jgi:hypothetical protein
MAAGLGTWQDPTRVGDADLWVNATSHRIYRKWDTDNEPVLSDTDGVIIGEAGDAPTAHDLAGALHNACTLAELNAKVSDATLLATGQATKYVVRDADNAIPDKDIDDFTSDSAWHVDGLDLSAIVPAGAIAVDLRVSLISDTVGNIFVVRRSATCLANRFSIITAVADGPLDCVQRIAIDSNRLLDYLADPGTNPNTINVWVVGYVMTT